MQQHDLSIALGTVEGAERRVEASPASPAPPPDAEPEPPLPELPLPVIEGPVVVVDDDDDELPWRRRRSDEERPHGGPPPDPDQVERQKRVEIYRRLWEQDSTRSLFVRPDSPPRRAWTPANTWGTGRLGAAT